MKVYSVCVNDKHAKCYSWVLRDCFTMIEQEEQEHGCVGDWYRIECEEMTEEQLNAMKDFDGWL